MEWALLLGSAPLQLVFMLSLPHFALTASEVDMLALHLSELRKGGQAHQVPREKR